MMNNAGRKRANLNCVVDHLQVLFFFHVNYKVLSFLFVFGEYLDGGSR